MKRASLPIERMAIWAKLAGIEMNNIEIVLTENCGNGITSTVDMTNDTTHDLISVPPSLILNKESVWEHARADKDLRTILEANKELASTERGAILLFLWIQFATTSADMPFKVGVQHPWTTYVQFLSDETSLPTFWTSEELEMFWGTSLASVMAGKLFALEAEFEDFKTSLGGTKLHKAWFDPDTGCASLHDWKVIDGMYRSRCMHLEGYGSCMVPIMDMANHARHTNAVASYSADPSSKKARLGFELEYLAAGSQITIPYYSYKGACESLFSYGFFEHDLDNARSLYLSIKAPEDDPLAEAKIAALDLKPGLQIIMNNTAENVHWGSPLVWAMSVNEEDGLEILKVMTVHGEEELVVKWKGLVISDAEELAARIKDASLRDIYKLRAHTLVQTRIEDEIQARYREKMMREQTGADDEFDKDSYLWEVAELLRWLETELLKIAATCSQATVSY